MNISPIGFLPALKVSKPRISNLETSNNNINAADSLRQTNFYNASSWSLSFGAQRKAEIRGNESAFDDALKIGDPVSEEQMASINDALVAYDKIYPKARKTVKNLKQLQGDVKNLMTQLNLDEKHICDYYEAKPVSLEDGTDGTLVGKPYRTFRYTEGKNEAGDYFICDKLLEYDKFGEKMSYKKGVSIDNNKTRKSVEQAILIGEYGNYYEGRKISTPDDFTQKHTVSFNPDTGKILSYVHKMTVNEDIVTAKERIDYNKKGKPERFYIQEREWTGLDQLEANHALDLDSSGEPKVYYKNIFRDSEAGIIEYDFKAERLDDGTWVIAE